MRLVLALVCSTLAIPALAADEDLKAEIMRLRSRIEALEKAQQRVDEGLAREEISEREPELTSRLKAVEYQALGMLKQARTVEALEGITVGVSFTTVGQRPSEKLNSQLNYRADVFAGLPLEKIGDVESRLFASIRFGQGNGLNDFYSYSKPNASAFRVTAVSPDDSVAILGQAWYQATIPLPFGGFKPHSKQSLEINFGKMDPFVFFDQNAAANDETRQFLNTVFVHNALLDAGGDIGFDANGFSPGFRASYYNYSDKREPWRLSAGVFGAGQGARYTNSFASTLVVLQADKQFQLAAGLPGNYRVYAWRNSAAPTFADETESRRGIGASLDQRITDATTLFLRYGHQTRGAAVRFNRALTAGAEIRGSSWNRGGDSIGLAHGWLRTASAFHEASGYGATGSEQVTELYYRYRINKQFELSPDLQFIRHPGGNPDTRYAYFAGLRAQITY
ncbi:MAG TPA: carbohydrate porin [Burkholderiales bacterium]